MIPSASILPSSDSTRGTLTVAVIGAGAAGRSLAAEAVRAGHRVVLEDVLPSKLRAALDEIATLNQAGTLELVSTVEDAVREADLVVDFVPDELESKLEIISMVDRMAPPKTVLCIPTRVLSIGDLASCTYRVERCIGAQVAGRGVELVAGARTSAETIALVREFWAGLGYEVRVVQESVVAG